MFVISYLPLAVINVDRYCHGFMSPGIAICSTVYLSILHNVTVWNLKISHISLKFHGIMHSTMFKITI